jgi:hypothetical protein
MHKRTELRQKTQKSNFFFSTKEIPKNNSFNKVDTKINIDLDELEYDVDEVGDQKQDRDISKSRVKFAPLSMKKFDEPKETTPEKSLNIAINSLPI